MKQGENMDSRLAQMEQTLLELGAEMYKLKHEIYALRDFRVEMARILSCLRTVLDEKGLISKEDFEVAFAGAEKAHEARHEHADDLLTFTPKKIAH